MAFKIVFNPFTGNFDFVNAGGGDVVGPSSANDNAIVRYDGTTGKLIKNSPNTTVQDSGAITATGFIHRNQVDGNVDVKDGEAWITPSIKVAPSGVVKLGRGSKLIVL
jgi:hypothetical protein